MPMPERQILTEEQLRYLRKANLERLMFGGHRELFAEWLVRGEAGEEIDPTGALAVFPVPLSNGEIDVELQAIAADDLKPEDLYREVPGLTLSEGALAREAIEFADMPVTGEQMLGWAAPALIGSGLPVGIIVFSGFGRPVVDQSVRLLAPAIIPPSIVLRLCQERMPRYVSMDVVGQEKRVVPEDPQH